MPDPDAPERRRASQREVVLRQRRRRRRFIIGFSAIGSVAILVIGVVYLFVQTGS